MKMATRGLWASLAIVVVFVSHPALGQWVGRMDEPYGVRQTSFLSVPTTSSAVEPDAPLPPEPLPGEPLLGGPVAGPGGPPPADVLTPIPAGPAPVPGFAPGAPENSPCAADGGGYCCPPTWSLEQGVRILARSRTRRTNLSYERLAVAPYQTGPITTKSLSFDVAPGYYANVARYLGRDTSNRDHFVEFSYWGMNTWDASKDISGRQLPYSQGGVSWSEGSLMSYFNPYDHDYSLDELVISDAFNNALKHELYYTSEIHNFEVNLRLHPRGRPDRLVLYPNGRWRRERQPGCYLSYLAGLRGLSIDETFAFSSSGYTPYENEPHDVDRITNSGRYGIRTHNDMFGFQIGGELMFRDRLWEFGARYKLGPLLNYADQVSEIAATRNTHYTQGDSQDEFGYAQSKSHKVEVSGLAEIGVEGTYKITPNLSFHAAYDWIFITNLALAPEQVDYYIASQVAGYNSSRVNTNGHAMYHGLTLGLEFLW